MEEFLYLKRIEKLQNDVSIINSIYSLSMYRKDFSVTGELIKHGDGSFSMRRAKQVLQYYNKN